jgi:hypothetical protein
VQAVLVCMRRFRCCITLSAVGGSDGCIHCWDVQRAENSAAAGCLYTVHAVVQVLPNILAHHQQQPIMHSLMLLALTPPSTTLSCILLLLPLLHCVFSCRHGAAAHHRWHQQWCTTLRVVPGSATKRHDCQWRWRWRSAVLGRRLWYAAEPPPAICC